jgi:hypothetical protein
LTDLRQLGLELEEQAGRGDRAKCTALIAQLNQHFLAVRPILERLLAGLRPPASP